MQAWTRATPCCESQPASRAKPSGSLVKTLWRSLPPSRTRQALNLSFARSSPRGGSDMAVLLVVRRRASLANTGSAQLSGREILSGLRWRALRGGAGGLISPTGFEAGCRAQPHRRLVCGKSLSLRRTSVNIQRRALNSFFYIIAVISRAAHPSPRTESIIEFTPNLSWGVCQNLHPVGSHV